MQDLHKQIETPEVLNADARWQVVQRLAASEQFRRSHRLRRFLVFVSELALTGRATEVSEHLIGCQVFDRPEAYSSAEDNIVRSSARQLRSKVREYFETEGAQEPWIIEIPKGSYVPLFHERESQVVQPVLPPAISSRKRWRLLPLWITLAISCALAAAWATGRWNRSAPTLASVLLFDTASTVSFIPADSALVLMNQLGNPVSFEDFSSKRYLDAPPGSGDGVQRFWATLATRQTTSLADLTFVSQILKAHPEIGDRFLIRHPRNARARDFKSGSFIIHGGPTSNPWGRLFEEKLNFYFAEGTPRILNRKPAPGEQSRYEGRTAGNASIRYARIALVPNLSGTGKVLLVAGGSMESSEGAGEFLMRPASLELVRQAIGQDDLSRIQHLELLLQTSEVDGAPAETRLLASRF